MFAVPVPELYWHGRSVAEIPFDTLPSHYAVRPTSGWGGRHTFVMADGVNLLDKKSYPPEVLRSSLRHIVKDPLVTLLVEAFVRPEDGTSRLPDEYKFHMFGTRVAAIEAIRRDVRIMPNSRR